MSALDRSPALSTEVIPNAWHEALVIQSQRSLPSASLPNFSYFLENYLAVEDSPQEACVSFIERENLHKVLEIKDEIATLFFGQHKNRVEAAGTSYSEGILQNYYESNAGFSAGLYSNLSQQLYSIFSQLSEALPSSSYAPFSAGNHNLGFMEGQKCLDSLGLLESKRHSFMEAVFSFAPVRALSKIEGNLFRFLEQRGESHKPFDRGLFLLVAKGRIDTDACLFDLQSLFVRQEEQTKVRWTCAEGELAKLFHESKIKLYAKAGIVLADIWNGLLAVRQFVAPNDYRNLELISSDMSREDIERLRAVIN